MIWRRSRKVATSKDVSFENVLLVCTEDLQDPQIFARADELATKWNARLSVMAAVEPPSEMSAIAHATGTSAKDIERRLIEQETAKISDTVRRRLPDRELDVTVRLGKPFVEIIRHVIANDIDLIIKTAEQLPGIEGYLFASTDQHLLRKCPAAFWLHVPERSAPVKTVIAAVDVHDGLTSEPETLAGLNRRIVEMAARIATVNEAIVHVLHVWDAPGDGLVRMWSNAADPDEAAAAYVNEVRSGHARALNTFVEQARTWLTPDDQKRVKIAACLRQGAPRTVIPEQVHALNADILVMGTIARTGVAGFIIGNTAEDVLNIVDCSVVTIKPPNYVSPVALVGGT